MPHTRRNPGRPAQTSTEDILDAAERVGLDSLTRAAVAIELGVSAATIRHHVTSSERLYSLACARAFDRIDLASDATAWQDYLRVVSARFGRIVDAHPGVEDYVLRGPYEQSTLDRFDRIITELEHRDPRMDRRTAHLVGSRTLILTAAMRIPGRTRYSESNRPDADRISEATRWTLDAFFAGADSLIEEGRVPEVTPTPDAPWARVQT